MNTITIERKKATAEKKAKCRNTACVITESEAKTLQVKCYRGKTLIITGYQQGFTTFVDVSSKKVMTYNNMSLKDALFLDKKDCFKDVCMSINSRINVDALLNPAFLANGRYCKALPELKGMVLAGYTRFYNTIKTKWIKK